MADSNFTPALFDQEFRNSIAERKRSILAAYPPGRWKAVDFSEPVPHLPGCYAIVGNGRAYYIGQSGSLADRFYQHGFEQLTTGVRTPKWGLIEGAQIKIRLSRSRGEHLATEERMIARLIPEYNQRGANAKLKLGRGAEVVPSSPYRPSVGEPLISLEEISIRWKVPVSTIRRMAHGSIVEALPANIVDLVLDGKL